jgi:hypothetical protein
MGQKASSNNGSKASRFSFAPSSRYKSEREQNEESRAKRVGMLCRWINECKMENEMLELMKQLRELCGELSAKLFALTELQAAITADAEKVVYAICKAMIQFPENDTVTIMGLEIFKLINDANLPGKCGVAQQVEQLIRVMESTLDKPPENNNQASFTAEDLEKLLLSSEIVEGLLRSRASELPREKCFNLILRIFQSIPPTARTEFKVTGFMLTEKLCDPTTDQQVIREIVETMAQDGLSTCEAVKRRWGKDEDVSPVLVSLLDVPGTDINHPCSETGRTALHTACMLGEQKTVDFLLGRGADVNRVEKLGMTPLHYAIQSGRLEIVKLLLNHSAKVDICDTLGNSALHAAVLANNPEVVEEILLQCNENQNTSMLDLRNGQGLSPLLLAVWEHAREVDKTVRIINLLVAQGCDVVMLTPSGASALIIAVHRRRDISLLQELIKAGCDKAIKCQGLMAYDIALDEGASDEELDLLRVN